MGLFNPTKRVNVPYHWQKKLGQGITLTILGYLTVPMTGSNIVPKYYDSASSESLENFLPLRKNSHNPHRLPNGAYDRTQRRFPVVWPLSHCNF